MMKIGVNIRNAYLLLKADFLKIFINKDGRVFMSRIIKNVLPYWKSIVLVFALLIVQAVCDLSLPAYTSDIIDTGIQNGGIEHTVPEKITKEEFDTAKLFMTEEEAQLWEQSYSYNEDDNVYELSVKGSKNKTDLDDTLFTALIINNQMSSVTESAFKSRMAEQMHVSEEQLANVAVEDIGKSMGVELTTFTQMMEDSDGNEVETTCVDMRQIVKAMYSAGAMSKDDILSMRSEFQKTIDTMGKTLVSSMGVDYAKSMDAKAGMDMDSIQTKYLWAAGLKMVAMALLMAVTSVCIGFLASRVGAGVARDMRGKLYSNVMGFSNAEMDKFSTASLITRTTNDVQQVQMVTVIMLRMILYAPILGVGGIIKVVGTGAGMGWVIVMAVAVIIAFVMLLMVIAMPKFKLMQKLVDNVNLVSREILTGLSVIRAFGREKKEEERFDEANKKLTKTMLFTNRTMTFMMPSMMFIMNGLSVLIVWVAAHRIDAGVMQVGSMTAFITYSMLIVMSFLMLTMMSVMLPRAMVAADRIDEVINTHSSIEDSENPETIESAKGVVEFNHVNFMYPGAKANALEDITFKAEPGKTTAIIGSTGCGKSTLVNLIPRLYDVTGGSITIDGHDIRNISMHDLRSELGYVPQKGMLFSGTIASNLRFGNPDASDEDVVKAAQIAQAFFSTLEAAGYKNLGIYSNASRFDSKLADGKLTASIFNQYPKWVASYNDTCKYQGNYHMWQYSNVGTIDGISENVDLNFKIGNWKKAGFTPKKVTLDKTSLTMTTGTSKTIKAYDPANSAYKLSVQWKSSNTKIATVDKNGKITAKSAGKVNITAVLNSQAKATCQVSIAPKPTKIKSVKKSGKNGIKITWSKVTGISNYQIYMSTKSKSGFKKIATISAKKTSYTKTKLKKGKKYYFKIRTAKKVSGQYYYSSYTAVKSAKR